MIEEKISNLPHILGPEIIQMSGNFSLDFKGVSTDSRSIEKGNLFIPLIGDNYDGHHYLKHAFENGAAVALTQNNLNDLDPSLPLFQVQNTQAALTVLARYWRQKVSPTKLIGLTGSNGKTTTKELIGHLLKDFFRTFYSKGNLNNHIGLPLSLLQMPIETEIAIIEMGMNHLGEIAHLAEIAQPHWGVITSIGHAHVGEVGGIENVAKAKCEILPYLGPEPYLFAGLTHPSLAHFLDKNTIACDCIFEKELQENLQLPKNFWTDQRIPVGYSCEQKSLDQLFLNFNRGKTQVEICTDLFGVHYAHNITMALCVGLNLGVPLEHMVAALKTFKAPVMRTEIRNIHGNTWILDCYNANPDSMKSLLTTLYTLTQQPKFKNSLVLVLGDMKELGDLSPQYHKNLAPLIEQLHPDKVFLLGEEIMPLLEELELSKTLKSEIKHFNSHEKLKNQLFQLTPKKYLVALKASRGILLEKAIP